MKTENGSSPANSNTSGQAWIAGAVLFVILSAVLCLSTLFHPPPAVAQTRVYQLTETNTLKNGDYFVIDVADSTTASGFRTMKVSWSNVWNLVSTNVQLNLTNYGLAGTNTMTFTTVSNYIYTNAWSDSYLSNYWRTNVFWTNSWWFTNFLEVLSNWYGPDVYVSNYFETNLWQQYISSNFFTTNILNQYITSNYTTVVTNTRIFITEGLMPTTNRWNGPSNALQLRFWHQAYASYTPCFINGVTRQAGGENARQDQESYLTLFNLAATNWQLTLPDGMISDEGMSGYTCEAGAALTIHVRWTPNFSSGGWTNCEAFPHWYFKLKVSNLTNNFAWLTNVSLAGRLTNGTLNANQYVEADDNKALRSTLNGSGWTNLNGTNVTGNVTSAVYVISPALTNQVPISNVISIKGYIVLASPFRCDGTGCKIYTNDNTKTYYGQGEFDDAAAKSGNYVEYFLTIPEDIDTTVDLRVERWKFQLGGADTGKHYYEISFDSVADSAAYAGSLGDPIALKFGGDGSGASGDVETVSNVTLTGWKSALTAGQLMVIRVARAGDDGTDDTSTVNSYSGPLVISYGIKQ